MSNSELNPSIPYFQRDKLGRSLIEKELFLKVVLFLKKSLLQISLGFHDFRPLKVKSSVF